MPRWLSTLFSPKQPKLSPTRLRLEQMEDRLQPSSGCLGGVGGLGSLGGCTSDGFGGGCGNIGNPEGGGCGNGGGFGLGGNGGNGGGFGIGGHCGGTRSTGSGGTCSGGTGSGGTGTGSTGTASVTGNVIYTLLGEETGPAVGDTVTLTNAQGTVVATTTTDSNGNYSFSSLAAGTYTLTVYDAYLKSGSTTMSVTVTAGQEATVSTVSVST